MYFKYNFRIKTKLQKLSTLQRHRKTMRGVGLAAGENFWGFETSENVKNLQKSMFLKTAGGENFWGFTTFKVFPPLFLHDLQQGGGEIP